jgi:hypothetical protein
MRILKNATVLLVMGLVTLFALGCEEQQLERADRIVADANSIISAGGAILQSPAGALLPPGFQLYGAAGIAIASIILNSWQKVRANLMTKTTKAIVKGIESAETKQNPSNPIKVAIGNEMRAAGIYDKGNLIVDQLKVAR